ncbi:MAG: hypothetical protein ACKPKO_65865, partial [Candidatus Fonsibacter sp.]
VVRWSVAGSVAALIACEGRVEQRRLLICVRRYRRYVRSGKHVRAAPAPERLADPSDGLPALQSEERCVRWVAWCAPVDGRLNTAPRVNSMALNLK